MKGVSMRTVRHLFFSMVFVLTVTLVFGQAPRFSHAATWKKYSVGDREEKETRKVEWYESSRARFRLEAGRFFCK
jgi:hypothetical protein